MKQPLKSKILSSAKLSTINFSSQIFVRLISTVILTRLLNPEIYGVFAVILLYRYILEMLSDLGIRSVVLTKEGDLSDRFLETAWTVSIFRGIIISLVTIIIAVSIYFLQIAEVLPKDSSYSDPVLPFALGLISFTSIIAGFQSTNVYASERKMEFKSLTVAMVMSNVLGVIATITAAYFMRNVWALVLGAYIQVIVLIILSFKLFDGPKMRFSFERAYVEIIISRGKWIIGHSTLTAISQSADRLVLGFILSSSTFGIYFIARQVTDLFLNFFTTIHSQMGLQVFREIISQSTKEFVNKYYKYRKFIDILTGIIAGGIFIAGQIIVDIIFDERYRAVGDILSILIVSMIFIGPLCLREAFSAQRKFREMSLLSLASTIFLWFGLCLSIMSDNMYFAFWTIAIYKVPEVLLLYRMGYRNKWLNLLNESLILVAFTVGILIGLIAMTFWNYFI